MDAYFPGAKPAPIPTTSQTHYTEYEPAKRSVRSFLHVPYRPTSTPQFSTVSNSAEDNPIYAFEHEDCEQEASGLVVDLVHKRRRMAVSTLLAVAIINLPPLQDNPLLAWVPHIDTYVGELLRLEGRGNLHNLAICSSTSCETRIEHPIAAFRCRDCLDSRLFCGECIKVNHHHNPFHRIQVSAFRQ